MDWTEETISHLRSLWQEGLSTAEIGRRMSITKNAVVGKAHRLTLPARPSPIRKALALAEAGSHQAGSHQVGPRSARVAQFVPRPVVQPAAKPERREQRVAGTVTSMRAASPPKPQHPATTAYETMRAASAAPAPRPPNPQSPRRYGQSCCWPLGEPGTKQFHFCGGEPLPGKPYCGEHAQLAYVKLRDRRDTVA